MYVAKDVLTGETVGPFNTEDAALAFTMEASDLLDPNGGMAFDIQTLWEPEGWVLNNTPIHNEEDNYGSGEEDRLSIFSSSDRGFKETSDEQAMA
jgi:hypothetical protein